jgi:hypothetical protein
MKRAVTLSFILLVIFSLFAQAKDVWSYRGEITHKGTRSEGFLGRLFYFEKEVPSQIAQVVTPIGEYQYVSSDSHAWGRHGWLRVSQPTPIAVSRVAFEPSAERHWYRDDKRPDTPRYWVYLPAHHAWVDQNYFQQFVDSELKAEDSPAPSSLSQLADEVNSSAPSERRTSDAGTFVYRQFVAGAGTKSAGLRGTLLYEGRPLQHTGTLRTPIGTFHYVAGNLPWHPQGWFPADEITVRDSAVSIDPAELKKGRYTGPRKAGTPSDWCYAPDEDTWYSPAQL